MVYIKKIMFFLLIFSLVTITLPVEEIVAENIGENIRLNVSVTKRENSEIGDQYKKKTDEALNMGVEVGELLNQYIKERTCYSIEHIDYKTGKTFKVDENIDGFINETVLINKDFVNVFRGYKYKKIRNLDGEIFKAEAELKLSDDLDRNKIFIVYEESKNEDTEEQVQVEGESIEIKDENKPIILDKIFETEEYIPYMEGYADGSIRAESEVSREEVASMIYKLLNKEYKEHLNIKDNNFNDLDKTRWSYEYINTLASGNILMGDERGSFRPTASITRGELARVISRFDKIERNINNRFSDIEGHWAEESINSIGVKAWIKGYEDGRFRPDEKISRAEVASIFNKMSGREGEMEYFIEEIKNFDDLKKDKWYYKDIINATHKNNI